MFKNFTANGTEEGKAATRALSVTAAGTWGGGTLTFRRFASGKEDFLKVDSWTADVAKEIIIGAGTRYEVELSGATSPNLDVSVEDVHGDI